MFTLRNTNNEWNDYWTTQLFIQPAIELLLLLLLLLTCLDPRCVSIGGDRLWLGDRSQTISSLNKPRSEDWMWVASRFVPGQKHELILVFRVGVFVWPGADGRDSSQSEREYCRLEQRPTQTRAALHTRSTSDLLCLLPHAHLQLLCHLFGSLGGRGAAGGSSTNTINSPFIAFPSFTVWKRVSLLWGAALVCLFKTN